MIFRPTTLLAAIISLSLLLGLGCTAGRTDGIADEKTTVRHGRLILSLGLEEGRFSLADEDLGLLLDECDVSIIEGDGDYGAARGRPIRVEAVGGDGTVTLSLGGGRKVVLDISGGNLFITAASTASDAWLAFSFVADAGGVPGFLKDRQADDGNVLVTTLGPATVPGARSLYLPEKDLALTASVEEGGAEWLFDDRWRLRAAAQAGSGESTLSVTVEITRDYYREHLGVEHFRPIEKRGFWRTAPVVAMTWYGICGIRQPQELEPLLPEMDWVAANLLPYAENLVFQLDDRYDYRDDAKMRALSDAIRGRGLIPGIWFTPYSVAPEEEYAAHRDWFLHDKDGNRLHSFGGLNWNWKQGGQGAGVLDVNSPGAVENWFAPFWRKASETWNFDFFKIDGQPTAVRAYRQAAGEGGVAAYRRGLAAGRAIVGDDKFINGCWGMPIEGAGIMNGSRTGGDTGYHGHAVGVIIGNNYLNNILWWCDPDAAAVQHDKPVESVRLNSQARALTGQQFLTDDLWTKIPPGICRVWQQCFPTLDIRPANLFPIGKEWPDYDLFDLRVAGPLGTFDVVGLFNFEGRPALKKLDLGRLPLEADSVHVFEYWSSIHLGRFDGKAVIERRLKPLEGQVFAVVPAVADRPVLISTSRHVSQGGLDVVEARWSCEGNVWTVNGRSEHLVPGDPYELVFASGRFRCAGAEAGGAPWTMVNGNGLARVAIEPAGDGSLSWVIRFEPITGPAVGARGEAVDLAPEEEILVRIESLGTEAVSWTAEPSDGRIKLSAGEGTLDPWPAETTMTVSVDAAGLEPGSTWAGHVDVSARGVPAGPHRLAVRVHVPPPENLALRATADASSVWEDSEEYCAARINDGRRDTRWNSRRGDENGCRVTLSWPEPVTFDRIVIDECIDWGPRIRSWRLEAGASGREGATGGREAAAVIARGSTAGSHHAVILENAVTAGSLTLVVEKAPVTPTIWELAVYNTLK